MTGILEQIVSQQAAIMSGIQQLLANGHAVTPAAPVAPAQPAVHDPFAAAPLPTPAAPAAVTEAQVMALIEPHLDNAAIKGALSQVLTQMGIARLPDARPDQYAAMYQAFQAVIAQHAAAGPAPAAPTSII